MKHLKAINQKANRIEAYVAHEAATALREAATTSDDMDVVGLRTPPHEEDGPHFPLGCSLVFSPGWEVDSRGGTAGLCQPVERGQDPRDFPLLAFGGAGPLHAVEGGRQLGIERVIVPGHPGMLSALGLLEADARADLSLT